jgi:hypothetical protein
MSSEESIVVLMIANPEPNDPFALQNTDGPVVAGNAD